MKLVEGVYEHLISNSLKEDMQQAEQDGMVCREEDLDQAEAPDMLAEYISRLVRHKLEEEELSPEEKKNFANTLIELINHNNEDKLAEEKTILTNVLKKTEEQALKIARRQPVRPQSGFRVSNLFTGGQSTLPLSTEIERDIASADRISLIVSFLRLTGVNLLYDALKKFCAVPGHQLRIITTTYCGVTEAKAVERLSQLPRTEIHISYNTGIERLHAKAYIFERRSGLSTAYIGSSNLSKSAQTDGLEWNIRVTNVENPHVIKTALATFDMYWNSPDFEDFRKGGIERFRKQMQQERTVYRNGTILTRYTILPHQKQLLDRLQVERERGVRRNLIVAATGTGKTVVSAFDYAAFVRTHDASHRLLFIAHREEILKQALYTYRSVLMDHNFGHLWVGSYTPEEATGNLFVSVQTFNSHFNDFFKLLPSGYYDYIVIDEAHHIAADSYRHIISHFNTPQLLIGLTATPERMDGKSLLPDFDNTVSAEIRLPQALDEGLLTPFQYWCITDSTDLTDDELMKGNFYIPARLVPRLCTPERTGLIVDRLRYYIADEHACRALCFCATKEHARYMAQGLRQAGLKAASLTSDNAAERDILNKKLEKGELNYLCVVDIFNEGVDIPSVDTVLFLRPTDSLTVFLQQLGRGLRLSPGKQVLTVLDFVARLNRKYDFSGRFRSLLLRTDRNLAEQVKNGFTLLPHGCSIHMEEKAQQYVLQNIQAAIYNKTRLIRELRTFTECPSITTFLAANGQDVRLLYSHYRCWTLLKKEAGLCSYEEDDNTRRFVKGIGTLCHVNTRNYLDFIRQVMAHNGRTDGDAQSATGRIYSLMLYYALFQEPLSKTGFSSVYEALAVLKNYPLFVQEIKELTDYLGNSLSFRTFPVGDGMPAALEQYGYYTREEVFMLLGKQTARKRLQGSVTGVFRFENLNTEAFFVTLNKSDKDFSPSTQYKDYVMGEWNFHWQSQNTDAHNGSGRRFVEQRITGRKFLLFVREYKQDGFGNTCPFHCFGFVDYVRSYSDRPMNIEWHLHEPVLPMYLKSV